MSRYLALVVLLLLGSACDQGEPTERPNDESRSLLSLLADAPRSGTWELDAGEQFENAQATSALRGSFWRVGPRIITEVEPFDAALVKREVARILQRNRSALERVDEPPPADGADPASLYLLRPDYYRGALYDLDVQSVLRDAMGPLAMPINQLVVRRGTACATAVERHREGVDKAIAGLEPRFAPGDGIERWIVAIEPIGNATATTRRAVVEACGMDGDGTSASNTSEVHFERSRSHVAVRFSSSSSGAPEEDARLTVTIARSDRGSPPKLGERTSAFNIVSHFLLMINRCGGLPWEYSNFAAGDRYTPPDHDDYLGPTPFVSWYECEADVSPEDKADALSPASP